MATAEFLERIAKRIDRIDRKSLENYALELMRELKFVASLLNKTQEGIMIISPDEEVQFINRRMAQLLDISEDITRKHASQIISDSRLSEIVSKAVSQKKEIFHQEFEVLLPRPMILRVNLLFEKKETPAIFILSIMNMTETETNIRERYQRANWESMLGLAAGIAHELGNPLNSMTIHLKLLQKLISKIPTADRKKAEESFRVVEDETARLDQIIRNFLKATRRKPLRFESVAINELLEKTLSVLKPELKHSKIKIVEEFDQNIPSFLLDPDRIQQVIMNIVKNAIHAMPKGGTLTIQTESKDKLCVIHFQDTGVGMPSHVISKIFEAYYTTKDEGSGLGLMIVHQVIKEHGGRIEVKSKPGRGTTFSVILPMRKQRLRLPEPAKGEA